MGVSKNQLFSTVDQIKTYVDNKTTQSLLCTFTIDVPYSHSSLCVPHALGITFEELKRLMFLTVSVTINYRDYITEETTTSWPVNESDTVFIPVQFLVGFDSYDGTVRVTQTVQNVDGYKEILGDVFVHFSITSMNFVVTGLSLPTYGTLAGLDSAASHDLRNISISVRGFMMAESNDEGNGGVIGGLS